MRTHFAITTALALGIPALPAGPVHHAAESSAPKAVVPANKAPGRRISPPAAPGAGIAATADTPAPNALTLEARQLQGAEAISVAGNAPAGSPITITLLATVSKDVPTIVVSRHSVVADSSGHFAAVIPIASAFERGTLLNILATSVSGAGSAQAQLITGEPNAGVAVPLESEQ
jgi:hypothetical protein